MVDVKEDVGSGLPQLPKDMYWKLERHRILIMKRAVWFFMKDEVVLEKWYGTGVLGEVTSKFQICIPSPVTEENVWERCVELVARLEEESLYGTYPPKIFNREG